MFCFKKNHCVCVNFLSALSQGYGLFGFAPLPYKPHDLDHKPNDRIAPLKIQFQNCWLVCRWIKFSHNVEEPVTYSTRMKALEENVEIVWDVLAGEFTLRRTGPNYLWHLRFTWQEIMNQHESKWQWIVVQTWQSTISPNSLPISIWVSSFNLA